MPCRCRPTPTVLGRTSVTCILPRQLARAVYADRDILVADDPLSAVDVHVGRHLWSQCIMGQFVARGRTVLIATHQLQYLYESNRIVVMDRGCITHLGTHADLLEAGVDLQHVVRADNCESETGVNVAVGEGPVSQIPPPSHSPKAMNVLSTSGNPPPVGASPFPSVSHGDSRPRVSDATQNGAAGGVSAAVAPVERLIVAEDRRVGSVSSETLVGYFSSAGGLWVLGALAAMMFASASSRQVS